MVGGVRVSWGWLELIEAEVVGAGWRWFCTYIRETTLKDKKSTKHFVRDGRCLPLLSSIQTNTINVFMSFIYISWSYWLKFQFFVSQKVIVLITNKFLWIWSPVRLWMMETFKNLRVSVWKKWHLSALAATMISQNYSRSLKASK